MHYYGDSKEDLDRYIAKLQNSKSLEGIFHPVLMNWEIDFQRRDTRPDIFQFEIPGAQGMFMLGKSGKTHTIPYQNINIEYLDRDGKQFKITDNNGYEYYFGAIIDENGQLDLSGLGHHRVRGWAEYDPNRLEGISPLLPYETIVNWGLRKIQKDGRVIVTYEYTSPSPSPSTPNIRYGYNWVQTFRYKNGSFQNEGRSPQRMENTSSHGKGKFPSSIRTENEEIKFIYGSEGLKSIDLYYNSDKIRTISFDYGSFSGYELNYKLNAIKEQVKNTAIETIYAFDYDESVNLPSRTQTYGYHQAFNSFDHWGYYNGANNNIELVELSSFSSFNVLDTLTGKRYTHVGADRNPNFEYAKARSLTRINYSKGGYREFEYEPHVTSDNKIVGGLRIKSIKECDETGHVASKVRYTYIDKKTGLSSGIMFRDPEEVTAVLSLRDGNWVKYRV